jgi:hypothetical protein
MEAIITRVNALWIEADVAAGVRAVRRVARALAHAVGSALVETSRGALLVKNRARSRHRL